MPAGRQLPRENERMMDHATYLELQTGRYKSFESMVPGWEAGQRRYLEREFFHVERSSAILDVACGDGVGLRVLHEMGFLDVTGFEYDQEKVAYAIGSGCGVIQGDFHDLSIFVENRFHVVYSSHSLEHALEPDRVLREFYRVLCPNGELRIVLPFPDTGPLDAHVAKEILGTHEDDGGARVIEYISSFGFALMSQQRDSQREPEIWLRFHSTKSG